MIDDVPLPTDDDAPPDDETPPNDVAPLDGLVTPPAGGSAGGGKGKGPTLPQRVRQLEQILAQLLQGEVLPLADVRVAAATGSGDGKDQGGPWLWTGISSDRRQALSAELVGFVDWLCQRYLNHVRGEHYPFPARWFEQPVVVEMLTALMVSHQAAYSDTQTDPSTALSDWHLLRLWPTLDKIAELAFFKDGHVQAGRRVLVTDDDATAVLSGGL